MDKPAIVVLGSPNDSGGNLSTIAIERCQQALTEYSRHPDACIIPTGGWGDHFNTTDKPHGHYIRQYLIAHGVPERQILECAESTNTIQDAALVKPIVERHGITSLIVVTSDFHVPRAQFLFQREFPDIRLSFSAAKTNLPEADLMRRRQHEETALTRLKALIGTALKK
ncbi:MAG: YdcF family protein [Kiritimatiellae bacterium]|nr:YdcF family protein [Kiritimatiellia bacterium]MDD5520146.1 YdcF family protein [Kiritimatiellia bacterium]